MGGVGGWPMGVGRLSGRFGYAVWTVWAGCVEKMARLSRVGGEAGSQFRKSVWWIWRSCLESVHRLCGGCGEDVCEVWAGCLEGVGRLI